MTRFTRICQYPGCTKPGEYPAPRSANNIKEKLYFCLDHVREYNRNWNGLEGFSEQDIFNMQNGGATWNRPTWRLGMEGLSQTAAFATYDEARLKDFYNMFKEGQKSQARARTQAATHGRRLPTEVSDACLLLGVKPPITLTSLKQKYRTLAKKHHPDVNHGSADAEDMLKRINRAYNVVLSYIEKHEKRK